MNNRLIEIIKNPDLLVSKDIEILEKEISQHPFAQSFRALQLLATHRFDEDLYPEKLSETAAFTTDKKILYHLIHQKEIEKNAVLEEKESGNSKITDELKSEVKEEKLSISKVEKLISTPVEKFQEVVIISEDSPKPVYIGGELNRILFEGEENFLNEETETVDIEASQESGTLVIASKDGVSEEFSEKDFENNQSLNDEDVVAENKLLNDSQPENLEPHEILLEEATREFTTETIINEKEIKSEEDLIENPAQLSFHGSEEFLTDVKIEVKKVGISFFNAENKARKHEIEMQKLIAEVNAKMKSKSTKIIEKEDDWHDNHSLDFTGISHDEKPEEIEKIKEKSLVEKPEVETPSTWKPMNFGNEKELSKSINDGKTENLEKENDTKTEDLLEKESQNSSLEYENKEIIYPNGIASKDIDNQQISNISNFIDTWQSWLKLGAEPKPKKEDVKKKAIETFIEREPKISKLKEDSNFVIKEKGDNISHLMTETLANLYLDQKLYSKAKKAFELLIKKEPEKSEKFRDKIKEIKDLRS